MYGPCKHAVGIQVELDALRRLLDLDTQEVHHALTAGEIEILGIQSLEFVLELLSGGNCRKIIHKRPDEDEVIAVPQTCTS